jgi:phenylacetic acid degradation operon negative regulatory protein
VWVIQTASRAPDEVARQTRAVPARNDKLVSPAIVRKLDPTLGGVEESVRELESISLPRFQVGFPPQRLTMTLLGEFWAGRTEALPSAAFVRLLEGFDINEQAARVALGRLAARGALIMERRGRTTWYRQSPDLLDLLAQGRAVTDGFGEPRVGWDGTWSIVTWSMTGGSSASAHRVRTSLRELGYAPLSPGVWVSPDQATAELKQALSVDGDVRYTVFVATEAEFDGADSPIAAWDLDDIRPKYLEFLKLFKPEVAKTSNRSINPAKALVTRTRAVYRWFVIAALDPDLPAELLPVSWPRAEAHRLFVEVVNCLTPFAEQHVRSVISASAPELAELVTLPWPYGASGHSPTSVASSPKASAKKR